MQIQDSGDLSSVKVVLGAHDITKRESAKRIYSVQNMLIHPRFGSNTPLDYNFALIQLAPGQDGFHAEYRPVCLPRTTDPFHVGSTVVAAGWGRTSEGK